MHFLDLASAVEKLRWAEKEWRELDKESAGASSVDAPEQEVALEEDDESDADEDAELLTTPR